VGKSFQGSVRTPVPPIVADQTSGVKSASFRLVNGMTLTRRQFLGTSLVGVAALGGADDAFFHEPGHPVGEQVQIYLERLPESFEGFRIAQLSDIHFGPYMGKAGVERALKIAESFQPD